MTFETYRYTIASHFVPALINGDVTGLDANDEHKLDVFVANLPGWQGHWEIRDDAGFARCEVTDLHAECVHVDYLASEEE